MPADANDPVRTFVLLPEQDTAHAVARRLRENPALRIVGVATSSDADAYRIFHEDPDVIVADVDAGGLQFLTEERLPPGTHRVVFFAPRSESGCDACYEALTHGADAVHCRPASAEEASRCDDLLRSIMGQASPGAESCPAVERLRREHGSD